MTRIFISQDAASLALGSSRLARAIADHAAQQGIALDIVRTGSRGLFWLEPLVEIETAEGRIAYGPIQPPDMAGLFDADFLSGGDHPLRVGRMEDVPYFARQQR